LAAWLTTANCWRRARFSAIDLDDPTASLGLAHAVTDYFEITEAQAHEIASEVGQVVSRWRAVASALGVSKTESDRMASAFEHEDLSAALA
jgi:serine/threonine-protein kinase HipA